MVKNVVLREHQGSGLPIEEFKLESMVLNPSICMIAKRGSGKSWVCRSILKHYKHLPCGLIISPTDEMNSFYGNFFPDLYIHYEYKSEILINLFNRQKDIIKKCKYYFEKQKKVDPRSFLLMDDCMAEGNVWKKDKQILQIFYNGRHYGIMFILTMQEPLGIPPSLRSNIDYVFILFTDFYTNQKKIFEHYAGMFPTFDFFRQVFLQLTDDYGCMVIVNRGAKRNLIEKIFYYKAIDDEKMVDIGCKQFRQYHNYNYNKHYDDEDKKFDINDYGPKSNKPTINVNKIKK